MGNFSKAKLYLLIAVFVVWFNACNVNNATVTSEESDPAVEDTNENSNEQNDTGEPKIPNLQAELLNGQFATTDSPIGKFDFENFAYPLPRGWQDADGKEIKLVKGKRRMTENKIGMDYVTTKFFDLTGDEDDEAAVILKVGTGGGAIPQIVYLYEWENGSPRLLWYFRTGDRADGGLKKIYSDEGELVVELFGRDRYIFSQMETSKIIGDEQQLCCPTHWTKTRYRRTGGKFVLAGDRWTYSIKDKLAKPLKNLNEAKLKEERGS